MSMGLKPCECGNEDLKTSIAMSFIGPHILVVRCEKCMRKISGPSIWVEDTWNIREPGEVPPATPGPATKAMLDEVHVSLSVGWCETVITQGTMEAFLKEWGVPLEMWPPRMP